MAFTGKATYSAGTTLPELAEDVADLIGIISPYETPLLDALGDPLRAATSTHHEWLEDELLPNKDSIDDQSISSPSTETDFDVANGSRFQVGDQIQVEGSKELMLVTAISSDTLTVVRGYSGTTAEDLVDGQVINILGNAALEGSDKPSARFTSRSRCGNYTQIFAATVEVSGTDMAANQLGLSDEMDYQKQERLRELIRDLENTVINGRADKGKMRGVIETIVTNIIDAEKAVLDENLINKLLRTIWESSNGNVDLIVVGGFQKRKINSFLSASRSYGASETTYRDMVSVYESDFGVCKIITTRWMPHDAALLLDSARTSVLPLAGRSFHFKPLASSGDYECGELIGEYTLEMKNEAAHGLIRDLSTS